MQHGIWHAPEAQAATGAFSVFRNDADTTAVNNGAGEVEVVWDTVVTENSDMELQGDNTTIDLVDTGKYLVLYNVWTNQVADEGNQRRSFQTYLTVNGAELAYGRGDGYIRNNGADDRNAYAAGAAIIEAAAGDGLEINIERDDTSTVGEGAVRTGTNGVSVLQLSDELDYLRLRKTARSGDISGNTSFTDVTYEAIDELDTGSFDFTASTGNVTLKGPVGAYFMVTSNVRLNQDANSGNRHNFVGRLTLDGAEVPGTRSTAYLRGNANSNGIVFGTVAYSGIVRKTSAADQTLNVEVIRENIATPDATDIVANETALSIVAIPDTAQVISLTSEAQQNVPDTQAVVAFDEQIDIDTTVFSHSEVSNSSRVEIDQAGDYLFFSTVFADRSNVASGDRDAYRVEWRLDGSNTVQYGGHGSFLRGNQGTYDTFQSGSSGGVLLPGLTDTQYVEVTMFDETDNADAELNNDQVALQGVEVASLVPVEDSGAVVSIVGDQTATVDGFAVDEFSGQQIVITELDTARNLTNVVVTESGTVDAAAGLVNTRLVYDLDTTAPYDCSLQSYDGSEPQFGSAGVFSGVNGTLAFNDSVIISPTQSVCAYVVYDLTAGAADAETINFSIIDPSEDVTVTGGGDVSPAIELGASTLTTVVDPTLTQTGYHWRNDDNVEIAATSATGGVEDTPALAMSVGTPQRLRLGVAALGSAADTSSYQLEYAQKVSTCDAVTTWTAVGDVGGAWDMFDSTFVFEGADTTNIGVAAGGVSDGGTTFVAPNGAVRDVTDTTGSITLDADAAEFVEFEYAIEPTASVTEGVAYCFRLANDVGGSSFNSIRYNQYPEGTVSGDVTVTGQGTQTATVTNGEADAYLGGVFAVTNTSGSRTVTDVTVVMSGTVDPVADIVDVRLLYDLDTVSPYDCSAQSYDGTEPQFGIDGIFNASSTSAFTGSITITPTQSLCLYVEVDVAETAADTTTIELAINNPSQDVVVDSGSVGPGSATAIVGTTVVNAPAITQTGYHWRNDDADEASATSLTGGVENTEIGPVFQGSTQRLRLSVANNGSLTESDVELRLEYGVKVTTCENVGVWQRVDTGVAFAMDTASQLADGSDTTNISVGDGGVTDPGGSFVTPNGGQSETVDQLSSLALTTTEFVEVEYALELTDASAFGTTYCLRVSDAGVPLADYTNYAELTVQERQDFYVQHGNERVTGTSLTLTAGVDYDAPASNSSAFVRITNTTMTGAGSDTFGAQRQADDFFAYIAGPVDLTNSFTIERPGTATGDTFVSWEIVEYIGIAGGDNEFVVRDADALLYGATSLYATGTAVAGVVDDTDVAVFITGQLNPSIGSNDFNVAMSVSSWDALGDQPVFERGDADALAAGTSYAVVEFTGPNWNVQRVEHTYTAAGVTETELITAVNSLVRTFIHSQKLMGDELYNLDEGGHTVWLSSIGAASFELQAGATNPADHRSVAWVIENTQQGDGAMQVYRSNGTIANGGAEPAVFQIGIGGTVNVTSASIWSNSRSSGGGNFHPRVILGASILSETQYEFWRSDNGQTQTYRTEVVDWPVAETSLEQTHYRLYADNDTLTPTDPWPVGPADLGENTAMTSLDDPLGQGERVRLRMGVFVNNASAPVGTESFALQYGRRVSTCSAVAGWTDIGDIGSGAVWRGYDASPIDGSTLPTSLLSVTDVLGTYQETSPSVSNPTTIDTGEYVEYDWLIEHNGALQNSSYCFRMVSEDGSELEGYDVYPTVRTTGYTPAVVNWRWYDDEGSLTPTTALAAEQSAPIEVAASNTIKLRIAVTEVEGAPGEDIKFNLEYSQWADFRDGGTTLTATSSCVGTTRTWCYAVGAGIDNQTIDTPVLSGVDSCIVGVGTGCGTHNEAAALSGVYDQDSLTTSEHEFTLLHNSAGFDQVYYFRMVDATNGVPVVASTSYPSLTTAGAVLTFAVSGLDAGQTYEGVTLDATTTATGVDFGLLPFDASVHAGQRLTVFTNGTEGYKVYMQASQQLTSSNGEILQPVSGTNVVPSTWAAGCSASADSCFGYHAGDNILSDGSVRFAVDNSYAALDTTPVEVMASGVPVSFDASEIIYRTQITESQPAGEYATTLTYIVVPVF